MLRYSYENKQEVRKMAKEIPLTTYNKLVGYETSLTSCNCPDFQNRGGSYVREDGSRTCKHISELLSQVSFTHSGCVMFQTSIVPEYCGCFDWQEFGECCHVDHLKFKYAKLKPVPEYKYTEEELFGNF